MLKIIYDVDDTIWQLNRTICNLYGLDCNRIKEYDITKTTVLTEEEKRILLESYHNAEIFKLCQYNKGYERVFNLERLGLANVYISSASLNEEIRKVKEYRLLKEIPNINKKHVKLTVGRNTYQGRVKGDILIDDSPINIEKEDFKYNILINQPYNYGIVFSKPVIRVDSLNQAVDVVEEFVRNDVK